MLRTQFHNYNTELLIFSIVIAVGLATSFYLYNTDKYSLIYYGDSASHLIAARKIIDWHENPGLTQIGTVWLPLPHFLLIPFVLIDPLFTTGFAGVAVSLPSLAMTSLLLYKMIRSLTGYSNIAFAGALLYALNPNILYMGITAMTEAPFMLFFVGGAYYFQRWYQNQIGNRVNELIKCSILVSLSTFCRYEGWFIPVILLILVSFLIIKSSVDMKKKVFTILISLISFSCIAIWLIYNLVKYGNPFEFANAQYYSAASQALTHPFRAMLFMQPLNVADIYGTTVVVVYGPILLVSAVLGIIFYKRSNGNHEKEILFIFLAMPPIFTILSLLLGIGEMAYWFNARYSILLSPLIIITASLFVERRYERIKKKTVLLGIITVLFLYQVISPLIAVPAYIDAVNGFTYNQNPFSVQVGEKTGQVYDGGSIYTMTGSPQEHRIMISSGIALRNFDDITDFSTWKSSFKEPWLYDKWMIIGKVPDSDAQSVTNYWIENQDKLNEHYNLAYENDYYEILIRK